MQPKYTMLRKLLTSRRKSRVDHEVDQMSDVDEVTSAVSSALICQLPVEIFLAITFHLTDVSRWCLASTCRTLYRLVAQCHPLSLKSQEFYFSRRQLTQYWKLCARDLPDYLVCNVHTELYLWRPQHQVGYQCPKSAKISRYDPVTPHLCYPPLKGYRRWHNGLLITECLRDLILRYHLRGPQWGLPVSVLSHTCKGPISPAVYERKAIEGKLINGRLMVRTSTSHTTRIRRFKYWPVREEVFIAAVCSHSSYEVWLVFKAAIEHLINAQGLQEADFDEWGNFKPSVKKFGLEKKWYRCSTLLKCVWCATDVRISIKRTTLREMEITFTTYHDFGGFRRKAPQNAIFRRARNMPHHFGPSVEECRERLCYDLEDLYESSQERTCRNKETAQSGHSLQHNPSLTTASKSSTAMISSGFMASRYTFHSSEFLGGGMEAWPAAQTYTEYFIRSYDILQFELQT